MKFALFTLLVVFGFGQGTIAMVLLEYGEAVRPFVNLKFMGQICAVSFFLMGICGTMGIVWFDKRK